MEVEQLAVGTDGADPESKALDDFLDRDLGLSAQVLQFVLHARDVCDPDVLVEDADAKQLTCHLPDRRRI